MSLTLKAHDCWIQVDLHRKHGFEGFRGRVVGASGHVLYECWRWSQAHATTECQRWVARNSEVTL